MSALAGILRFDPRDRVDLSQLHRLARGIERLGPDRSSEIVRSHVGMAFRAFHTTPESRLEIQPLVRDDLVLAFDGRLDNRDDLLPRLAGQGEESPSDVELVYRAYAALGMSCFRELVGDWAISLWDPRNKQLILARDVFGVRRLFYRFDEGGMTWCTALEPLVEGYQGRLHLDLNYLAGCLYPRHPMDATPYLEIRACIPASITIIRDGGRVEVRPYWSLNPYARLRYKSQADYPMHFLEHFERAVRRRLRSDQPVLAELSGGLDSSSIVCMADSISREHNRAAVETLSYFDPDEPSGNELPFILRIEEHRGRAGHHISVKDLASASPPDRLAPLPGDIFSAVPGFFSNSLRWDRKIDEIQRLTGARIILSGLGGDELLGGVQYEALELAEHLRGWKLVSFFRSAYRWSTARRKTVYQLAREAIGLLGAKRDLKSLGAYEGRLLTWASVKPPDCQNGVREFARWSELAPAGLCMERIRFSLAQQLSAAEPSLVGCREHRYPYLDRDLFVFLSAIPRTEVIQPGKRRFLMRRAMLGLVPHEVLFRRTKWFGYRRPLLTLREEGPALQEMFTDTWLSDGLIVNVSSLRASLELALAGATDEALPLISSIAIEQWMRSLRRHTNVTPPA